MATYEADLVILGAGAAGAMAALAAHEQGASFVGLDQLDAFGGTAIISGGGMQVAGSTMQAARGIVDSPDQGYHDLVDGNAEADPAWARFYYDHAVSQLFEWLRGHELEFGSISLNEGDSVPRRHVPKGGGLGLMTRLRELHEEYGLLDRWHFGMRAEDVLRTDDGSGRVAGVRATGLDGEAHEFRGKCTIFATGGMAGNISMVLKYSQKLREAGRVLVGGGVGAQGTGHEILLKHGATLTNIDNFVIYCFATPDYQDPEHGRGLVVRGIDSCIWVNAQGRRFHNEALSGSVYAPPVVLAQQPPVYWAIVDHRMAGKIQVSDPRYRRGLDDLRDEVWRLLEQSPYIAKGDTVADLAQSAGIDPGGLQTTVERWNAALAAGAAEDEATGRILEGLAPLVEPPFYALQFWPLARKNQGGVRTDLQCRVLDEAGAPIPGLYAAGELCGFAGGHISGTRSLEGIMIGGSLFSGRVAGAWAAHETGAPEPTHLKP
jgi:predicted oxidoreductase